MLNTYVMIDEQYNWIVTHEYIYTMAVKFKNGLSWQRHITYPIIDFSLQWEGLLRHIPQRVGFYRCMFYSKSNTKKTKHHGANTRNGCRVRSRTLYIYICLYRKEIPEAYAKEQAFNRNKLRPFDFVNVYTSGDFRRYTIIQRYTGWSRV